MALRDFDQHALEAVLDLTESYKRNQSSGKALDGRSLGLLFGVASTRTRVSFQVAAARLGATTDYLNANDLQLVNHESLVDTARVLGRYLDGLIVRMYDMQRYGWGREVTETLCRESGIPIVNALDDREHPCQAMANLYTMREHFGPSFRNRRVLLCWGFSERQKSPGVAHSLLTAAATLGMRLRVATPPDFELEDEYARFALEHAVDSGAEIEFVRCDRLIDACDNVDVIYLKDWMSLKLSTQDDRTRRNELRPDWHVRRDHLAAANPGAVFMNCMPIIRGEQATADVLDDWSHLLLQEAENRLHVQKAILALLFEGSDT